MPRTLEMRQHARVILTLRPDVSVYDGSAIYRVAQGPSGNSKEVMAICERLERAHRRGEWCTVDDLMEELQAFRIWLYEGDRYIAYRHIGAPCARGGVIRFRDWKRWDGRGYDFPEQCLGHDFPELLRGHDFAELPDEGHDFAELPDQRHDFAELQ
jgi:hypothetical protein